MKNCFVCMPLIEELKDIFTAIEDTIYRCLGKPQWDCVKADDTRRPGMVDEKIVYGLLNADLVIAVIADIRESPVNPNVMYELGIAHSFRKSTIVVADLKNGLPFDIQSVETIQIDFSNRERRSEDLKSALQRSLRDSKVLDELGKKRIPRNPITTQLIDAHIFIEDLPWVWGYSDVLRRERAAKTTWEITSDLFWPGEPLFFATIAEAFRLRKKHYFMVKNDPGILRKAENLKNELLERGFSKATIDDLIHFVAIDRKYFVLWPIAVVLYDANLPTRQGGIICEPMQSQVGNDPYDETVRDLFEQIGEPDDLTVFERSLFELPWTSRKKEATFDISLDGRVVEKLATSFAEIWDEKIREEAETKIGDEKSTLLNNWLIGGQSE